MLDKNGSGQILEIVERELQIYEEIFKLSEEKRKALVEGKATELDRIVRAEQKFTSEVIGLEKKRDQILQEAVTSGVIGPEDTTVSNLVKNMEPELSEELQSKSVALVDLLGKIRKLNDLNGELIKQSLDYIEYTVNIISSTSQATNLMYGNASLDEKKAGAKKTFFDSKI